MNQITSETIKTADTWVEFSNQKNLERLSAVTAEKLALEGPKGTGVINHQELGEWMKRANLKLTTIKRYARGQFIVLEQTGTWLNDDDSVKGTGIVFTVFKIADGKVTFLARYDHDKDKAFEVSGLSDEDRIKSEPL
ncbi:hypothetical protein CR205_13280 [Alteribacter lacisalsi]|uniref:Nuclear transport factor 2 family protein n=1 Tax=Alteribacter lacisalsi TaxID=2045244 RepID=A0A2W0H7F5_9BACI|nr:hypothetical protein [Alteribacter lacisalsi]PYZ96666.1 hypothetical protein CR205_13280 [Alteribacter lacisalsi]